MVMIILLIMILIDMIYDYLNPPCVYDYDQDHVNKNVCNVNNVNNNGHWS